MASMDGSESLPQVWPLWHYLLATDVDVHRTVESAASLSVRRASMSVEMSASSLHREATVVGSVVQVVSRCGTDEPGLCLRLRTRSSKGGERFRGWEPLEVSFRIAKPRCSRSCTSRPPPASTCGTR